MEKRLLTYSKSWNGHIQLIESLFYRLVNWLSVFAGNTWFLLNHFHHLSFDSFFFERQPVLVPYKVWSGWVDLILLHTSCKLIDNKFVIWILSEAKFFAVAENFSKTFWVILSKGLNGYFRLLLFDVGVLLSLWSSWKTLPW